MKIITEPDYIEICVTEVMKWLYQKAFINHSVCPLLDWEKTEITINILRSCLCPPYNLKSSGEAYCKGQVFSFGHILDWCSAAFHLEMVEVIA